jgi:tRNA threonylcarbamoyladenosine biosynthesis protein TsaE
VDIDTRPRLALARDELIEWGQRFGARLQAPAVVAISGDLGAGKTTLVQAVCRGYGVKEPVTSPTFALVHEYASSAGTVYHLDLYRLSRPDELTNLGWDEIVNGNAVVLVEWPERAGARLPPDAQWIELDHLAGDPDRRGLRVTRS